MYLLFVLRSHNLKKNTVSNACFPQPLMLKPLKDMAKVDEVDYLADFDNLYSKMDDFDNFLRTAKVSYNIAQYIPGLAKVGYQEQLHSIETRRKYAGDTYKNKKIINFNVQIPKGHYTNFQNVHLCFILKFKSTPDNDNNIGAGLLTFSTFFPHCIEEIVINRYGDYIPILLLTNTVDITQCSDEILKHMPRDALKKIQNDLL